MILKREHKVPGRFFAAGSTASSRATTDRYENGVAWMMRRGAHRARALRRSWWRHRGASVARHAGLARARGGPGLLHRGRAAARRLVARAHRRDGAEGRGVGEGEPEHRERVAFTGFDFIGGGTFRNNAATIFVTMKHWDERKVPGAGARGRVLRPHRRLQGRASPSPSTRRPIFALGATGGFEMHLQNHGDGRCRSASREVTQMFIGRAHAGAAASRRRRCSGARTCRSSSSTWTARRRRRYGVPIDEVFNALAATLGTYYVNDFNKYGRTWQVLMSSEARYRKRPDDVGAIYVRSEQGRDGARCARSPTSSTRAAPTRSSASTTCPRSPILGSGAPGVSSGQALEKIEKVAKEALPPDFSFDWSGASLPGEELRRAPRSSRWWRAPSWRSSSSRRNTSAGRCRSR